MVNEQIDVAIVGGGVSGLSAAFELRKLKRNVVVLERSNRAGGVIQTERVGGFVIDAGPDALLVQKPAAVVLCSELGLGDRLLPTKPPRTAYILRDGELHPLPGASILGFPTRLGALIKTRLFSPQAKVRMAMEVLVPKRSAGRGEDESIAQFVRRRFGSEAVTYIAEPLLAGIHAGDVERLSMRALFPRLVDAEAKTGSVIRSFRRINVPQNTDGVFRSFPTGLAELIEGLTKAVPTESIHLESNVTRIEKTGDRFMLYVDGRPPLSARAVLLAVPAFVASDLLAPLDAELARACASIQYLSSATVVFAFPRAAVKHELRGTGFVVPKAEGISITAGAWISSKWPQRAPDDYALIRAFLGGARDPNVLEKTDAELTDAALGDLTRILNICDRPSFSKVYRWKKSSPQQEVGHGDLMKRIDVALATHPGLFISAAGFRGVGIPDCIADARETAGHAATFIGK